MGQLGSGFKGYRPANWQDVMRQTITYRFNKFKKRDIGSIPTLCRAIRGMNFTKGEINTAFKKFALKSEFTPEEHDEILEDLYYKNVNETPDLTLNYPPKTPYK